MQVRRGLQNLPSRILERERGIAARQAVNATANETAAPSSAAERTAPSTAPFAGDEFTAQRPTQWQTGIARAAFRPTGAGAPQSVTSGGFDSIRDQRDALLFEDSVDVRKAYNPNALFDAHAKQVAVDHLTKLDEGSAPGQGRILFNDRATKATEAHGEKAGVITPEKKQASERAADAMLRIQEGEDTGGPPRDFDVGEFARAAAERIPSQRIDAAQVANAAKYVLEAETLGDQKQRIASSLNALETLDQVGRPPMTAAEKAHDMKSVAPKLLELPGEVRRDHFDLIASVAGVPGEHKLQIDAKRTITIENDASGKTVKADFKVKKPSFFKKVVGIALTVLSVIPSPIQPFARVASSLLSAYNAAKTGNLLGAVASGLGAVAGFAGAVGGAAASAAASGLQRASDVLSRVNQVATGVRNGDFGAVVSGVAGAVAGLAGSGATGLSAAANRIDSFGRVLSGVQNRDLGQVLGGASGLAASAGNTALANRLATAGSIVGTGQALARGDLEGAAAGVATLAARGIEQRRARDAREAEEQRRAQPPIVGDPNDPGFVGPPELVASGDPNSADFIGPPELISSGDPNSPDFIGPPELVSPAPTPAPSRYQVRPNDTLSAIAVRNNTTVDAILAANPEITDANRIRVGQSITLPPSTGDVLRGAIGAGNDRASSVNSTLGRGLTLAGEALTRQLKDYETRLRMTDTDIQALERKARAGNLSDGERFRLDALRNQRAGIQALANSALAQNGVVARVSNAASIASIIGDIIAAATTDQQSSTAGRVANAAGNIGAGALLARLNPLVALADAALGFTESGVREGGRFFFGRDPLAGIGPLNLSSNLTGAVDNITGGLDALINGDSDVMRAIRESNLDGSNGVAFQSVGRVGEAVANSRALDPVFSGINYVQDGVSNSRVLDPAFAYYSFIWSLGGRAGLALGDLVNGRRNDEDGGEI